MTSQLSHLLSCCSNYQCNVLINLTSFHAPAMTSQLINVASCMHQQRPVSPPTHNTLTRVGEWATAMPIPSRRDSDSQSCLWSCRMLKSGESPLTSSILRCSRGRRRGEGKTMLSVIRIAIDRFKKNATPIMAKRDAASTYWSFDAPQRYRNF